MRFGLQAAPLAILCVVAREVLYVTVAVEDEDVVHHFVHEVAVVAHHDEASAEILQVLLEDLQRHDIEVVGGFVEDEEVGRPHEDGAQIESASLATAELIYIGVLLLGREEEVL